METNIIYNEDCVKGMKKLPAESIDLVVSDVAYSVITGGTKKDERNKRPQGILSENRKIFEYNDVKISDYMPEVYRVLKEGTHCYLFTNALNLREMLNESEKVGFKLHNLLVWEKNNCTPSQFYMKNCEYILFLRKGKAKYINNIGDSKTVHRVTNKTGKERLHPTEKPVNLISKYILNSSNKGDVVLDMFMGSGTTAISCLETGRRYIGYEIDGKYYNVSQDRIKRHKRKPKQIMFKH